MDAIKRLTLALRNEGARHDRQIESVRVQNPSKIPTDPYTEESLLAIILLNLMLKPNGRWVLQWVVGVES